MALTLTDIRFDYAPGTPLAQPALHGASLHVDPGELVLVLGTTGSGKSTLLRCAAGLLTAQSGAAGIDGAPLTAASARGRVGLVFQNAESQLFADTVLDDVMFGPRNLGASTDQARSAAMAALERVELDPATFAERSPFSLSGGEARRVAIAGVLAMGPAYLLADEPTAGLDARGRAAVRSVLRERRQDAGVVVVTHTAEEFLGEADRVVVLREGSMAWSGEAGALIEDPEPLVDAGLVPPAVLEVQRLARHRGARLAALTLDPSLAASRLAAATGWS